MPIRSCDVCWCRWYRWENLVGAGVAVLEHLAGAGVAVLEHLAGAGVAVLEHLAGAVLEHLAGAGVAVPEHLAGAGVAVPEHLAGSGVAVLDHLAGAGVVVVELPQTPEDDLRSTMAMHGKRMNLSQLVHVCSHGYGELDGAGMAVVDGMHAGQSQGGWSRVWRCRSTFRVRGDTMMTPGHTVVQMHSSR